MLLLARSSNRAAVTSYEGEKLWPIANLFADALFRWAVSNWSCWYVSKYVLGFPSKSAKSSSQEVWKLVEIQVLIQMPWNAFLQGGRPSHTNLRRKMYVLTIECLESKSRSKMIRKYWLPAMCHICAQMCQMWHGCWVCLFCLTNTRATFDTFAHKCGTSGKCIISAELKAEVTYMQPVAHLAKTSNMTMYNTCGTWGTTIH